MATDGGDNSKGLNATISNSAMFFHILVHL